MKRTLLFCLLIIYLSSVIDATKSPKAVKSKKGFGGSFLPLSPSDGIIHEVEKAAKAVYETLFVGYSHLLQTHEMTIEDLEEIELNKHTRGSDRIYRSEFEKKEKTIVKKKNQEEHLNTRALRDGNHTDPAIRKCVVGLEYYSIQEADLCSGQNCKIYEMDCGGVLYRNLSLYQGNLVNDCKVTTLFCRVADLYKMKEQFGADNCKVERVQCGERDRNISNVTPEQLMNCYSQIVCDDYRRYGFDYFGFYCAQDMLVCDGIKVNASSDTSLLNNCTIVKEQCSFVNSSSNCMDIQLSCEGDIQNGCSFMKLRSTCSQNPQNPNCKITKVNCNGSILSNIVSYSPNSLLNCTLNEISCDGGTSILTSNTFGQNCKIDKLICNGREVDGTYTGNLSNCVLTSMRCSDSSITSCTKYELACTNSPQCDASFNQTTCQNAQSCQGNLNTSYCVCPIDKYGDDCSKYQPLECNMTLLEPPLKCVDSLFAENDPKAYLLEGDRACLVFGIDDTPKFSYNLQCKFQGPINISSDTQNANFSYFIKNNRFAVFLELHWLLRFKIYDFNKLSDNEMTFFITLSKEQMTGDVDIDFNISLNAIPLKYWHGNRLYFELQWIRSPPGVPNTVDRRFIDSPDVKITGTKTKSTNKTNLILAIVLPIVGVLLIVAIAWYNRVRLANLFRRER